MEPEGWLLHFKEFTTNRYPKPHDTSPHHPEVPKILISILCCHLRTDLLKYICLNMIICTVDISHLILLDLIFIISAYE